MNSLVKHYKNIAIAAARDYIKELAPILNRTKEENAEIVSAAEKAIDTSVELLEQWKNLGGKRTYGVSYSKSFIFDQPDSGYPPYMGFTLYFHMWPFGTDHNGAKAPESINFGGYFHRTCSSAEHFSAIVNDTLESIKKAEELINPTTKED